MYSILIKGKVNFISKFECTAKEPRETDTLFFDLNVKSTWNSKKPKDSSDPDEMYLNHKGLPFQSPFSFHVKPTQVNKSYFRL